MPPIDSKLTGKLDELSAEFSELEPRERLELLLEYSEGLPELPSRYQVDRQDAEHRVHECMTPVFLWVELDRGRISLHAWVAPEAPTVKGFVGILVEAFNGCTPEEVLAVEPNLVERLGLVEALGMMRMRGLHGIFYYIRNQIRKSLTTAQSSSKE